MRKATAATLATIALGLAIAHPWAPPSEPARVYLPMVVRSVAMRAPRPIAPATAKHDRERKVTPASVLRPGTAGELIDALNVPGALVLPEPGRYWFPVQARVAAGVTVDGRGAVTITGHGLMVDRADGATIAGLTIERVKGDGVTVQRSRGVLFERMDLSRASDGLLDLNGGATVTVRDSVFHDNIRGVLAGNWQQPNDGRERLTLERVTFRNVNVRTPKMQDADLIAVDLTVISAADHYPLDMRGTSTAVLTRYRWSGGKVYFPGWRGDPGTSMTIDGERQEVGR